MSINSIGFIGFGEAASTFAADIRGTHHSLEIYAFDESNNERMLRKANESRTLLVDNLGALLERADVILSLVPGKVAVKVAESVSHLLLKDKCYIDFNSVSPQTKKTIAQVFNGSVVSAVDATVMGSIPDMRLQVPILLAGGHAERANSILKNLGFNSSVVSENVGDAAAIKMVRSVFMKGMECLFMEMLLSGKKYGVMDYVVESISKSINGKDIKDIMNTLVLSQVYHSERKGSEMDYVIEVLNSVDVSPRMSTASRDTFRWLTDLKLRELIDPENATYEDIVEVVERLSCKES